MPESTTTARPGAATRRLALQPLEVVVGAALIALFAAHAQEFVDYTVDDAFISYRYGANLAVGHGLVFNPGEYVEGYSNLAWTLVFGAAHALTDDPIATVKGVGVALAALAMALLALLARDATGSRAAALGVLGLVAANRFVACWVIAGLETPLYLVELTAMALFASRDRPVPYGVAAALCCVTRPEAVALVGVIALERSWASGRLRFSYFVPLAAYAAQLVFRLAYYGDFVPNTAHVKLGGGMLQYLQGVSFLLDLARDWSLYLALPALLAAPLLVWRNPAARICLILVSGYCAFLVYSGGDFFPYYRLAAPLLPLATVVVVSVACALVARAPEVRRTSLGAGMAVLFAIAFVVGPRALPDPGQLRIDRETSMLQRFAKPAAYWLRDHSPPNSRLAISVAGAIPYYSGLPIIDRFGLMDKEIAQAEVPWEDVRSGIAKYDPESVLRREPTWILLDANEFKFETVDRSQLHPADRALLARPEFARDYRLVRDWVRDPKGRLALFVRRGSEADRALAQEPGGPRRRNDNPKRSKR